MRTFLLFISFILFSFLPSAYSQSYYLQTAKGLPDHHINGSRLPKQPLNEGEDSLYAFLDYYQLDSALYAPNFEAAQGQLINSAYSFPNDTTNSYKASSMFFMNYDCINAITVAFDSIPGRSADTISQVQIDTIYVPVIQVNHSGLNDTLEIQITTVNSNRYPYASTFVKDTFFIDTNKGNNCIGAGNNYTVNTIKWSLSNFILPGGRFAINITYRDSTKQDSCWFIYGYGSVLDTCLQDQQPGTSYFAATTHFSKVHASPKDFLANSFAQYNEYSSKPFLPDQTGDNIYYPCDTTVHTYNPVKDGVNYLQDIDIAANVLFTSFTGIQNLHSSGMSVNQNYPNPYNSITVINYNLIKPADISLKVVDLTGREIVFQNYGTMSPGQHSITLNANVFNPGVYFYSITGSGYTLTRKMMVY